MKAFQALRNQIDTLDSKLISLLQERAELVKQVKKVKDVAQTGDFKLYIKPDREYEILKKVTDEAAGYSKECFYSTWRGIISASNFLEQNLALLSICAQSQNDIFHHFSCQRIPTLEVNTHKAFELLHTNKRHILAFKKNNLEAFELLRTFSEIKIFSITHSLDHTPTFLCGKISLEYFQQPAMFLTYSSAGEIFIEEAQAKIFLSNAIDAQTIGAFYPLPL